MEQILIPTKRFVLLEGDKQKLLKEFQKRLSCKITLSGESEVTIEGEPYDEYNAKQVIQAFGRGFEPKECYKLLSEDYYFEQINMKESFRKRDQLQRMKARVIGEEGKAKTYIESVSGAKLSIFGSTVSLIGKIDEITVAKAALNVLINGGKHKTAYHVMENEKRKVMESDRW